MPPPQPVAFTHEEAIDMLAYVLATNARTSEIEWIVGDVGMGAPQQTPFAYISPRADKILWETGGGQSGGLPTGSRGIDMHQMLIPITVAVQEHQYLRPTTAAPPAASPLSAQSLGTTPPFLEQPGYRLAMQYEDGIRQALRENIVLGGEVATTTIIETAYVLQVIEGKVYRALRITLQAQQRRRRDA
jgi:hypothetical protein